MRQVKILAALALAGIAALSVAQSPPAGSIYDVDMTFKDQSGAGRTLDSFKGEIVLLTMFYASCPMACPLQVDTLRALERTLSPAERERVKVLMVTVDPERDTPQALATLAKERRIDLKRWTLARAEPSDTRILAAVLNIQYRKLPDGEFNHTSVITLLNAKGEMVKQSSVLGRADEAIVQVLKANLKASLDVRA